MARGWLLAESVTGRPSMSASEAFYAHTQQAPSAVTSWDVVYVKQDLSYDPFVSLLSVCMCDSVTMTSEVCSCHARVSDSMIGCGVISVVVCSVPA